MTIQDLIVLYKWPHRSMQQHRKDVESIQNCKKITEKNKLISKLGCRYSILLNLPYFDPIRMTILDPMHNLYLGSSKLIMLQWKKEGILSDKDLDVLQKRISEISVPPKFTKIPYKIGSGFSSLTADQLKCWTNIYFLLLLYDKLPTDHLE